MPHGSPSSQSHLRAPVFRLRSADPGPGTRPGETADRRTPGRGRRFPQQRQVPQPRALGGRRSRGRRRGCAGRPQRVLRRGRGGGCVEDDRRRRFVGSGLQGSADVLDRRRCARAFQPERRLGGHRGGEPAERRRGRPRRLHVSRCGQELAVHGSGRRRADHTDCDRSSQSGRRVRGRAGPRVGAQCRARRIPHRGRRQDLAEGVVRQRHDRRRGSRDGARQPARPVRGRLAIRALSVGARVGWSGERDLSLQGRRPHVGAAQGRPARGPARSHRPRRRVREPEPRVRAPRDEGGDAVGLEGPG